MPPLNADLPDRVADIRGAVPSGVRDVLDYLLVTATMDVVPHPLAMVEEKNRAIMALEHGRIEQAGETIRWILEQYTHHEDALAAPDS